MICSKIRNLRGVLRGDSVPQICIIVTEYDVVNKSNAVQSEFFLRIQKSRSLLYDI